MAATVAQLQATAKMMRGKAQAAKAKGQASKGYFAAAREASAKAAAASGKKPAATKAKAASAPRTIRALPPARTRSARGPSVRGPTKTVHAPASAVRGLLPAKGGTGGGGGGGAPSVRVITPAKARPKSGPKAGPTRTIYADAAPRSAVRGLLGGPSGKSTTPPDHIGRRGGSRKKNKSRKGPAMAAHIPSIADRNKPGPKRMGAKKPSTALAKRPPASMAKRGGKRPRARLPGVPARIRQVRHTPGGSAMLARVGPATTAVTRRPGNKHGIRFRKLQWEKSTKYLDLTTGKRSRAIEVRKFGRNPIGGWKDIASTGLSAIGGAIVSEIVSRMVATRMPEGGKHPFYSKDAALRIMAKPTTMEGVANVGLIALFLGGAGFAAKKGYAMTGNVLAGAGFGAIAHYGTRVFVHYILPMFLKVESGDEQTLANRIAAWEQASNGDAIAAEITRTDKVGSEAQADPLPATYKNGDAMTEGGYKWLQGRIIGIAPPQDAPKAGTSTTKSQLGSQGRPQVFDTADVDAQNALGGNAGAGNGAGQRRPTEDETRDALAAYINDGTAQTRTGCGGNGDCGGDCGGGCGGNSQCGPDCGCDSCQEKYWGRPSQGGPQGGGSNDMPNKRDQYANRNAPSEAGSNAGGRHDMNSCGRCQQAFARGVASPCAGQSNGQRLQTQPEQQQSQTGSNAGGHGGGERPAPQLPAHDPARAARWQVPTARNYTAPVTVRPSLVRRGCCPPPQHQAAGGRSPPSSAPLRKASLDDPSARSSPQRQQVPEHAR